MFQTIRKEIIRTIHEPKTSKAEIRREKLSERNFQAAPNSPGFSIPI